MPDNQSAFLAFHPENATEQIPALLPSCKKIEERDGGRTLIVHLSGQSLNQQELGRLTIINGKCRNQGLKIILSCSHSVAGQLAQYNLDRLMWVETKEMQA